MKKRYRRREIAPGYKINAAGDVFRNKRKVERHGSLVIIRGYTGPLQATYDTVWRRPRRVDWLQYLTQDELDRRHLKRYTYEGEPHWYPDETRPLYRVDELVLVAFDKKPPKCSPSGKPWCLSLHVAKPAQPKHRAPKECVDWVLPEDKPLPIWLCVPRHKNGDPQDCHLDNLEWVLSDAALEAHGLRQRAREDRDSALMAPNTIKTFG